MKRVNPTNFLDRDEPFPKRSRSKSRATEVEPPTRKNGKEPAQQSTVERRVLRTHYYVIKHIINDEKEEICHGENGRFQKLIEECDRLHQLVIKPREQVTDAETLLDMANTLVTSVKSHSKEGFTPAEFISSLMWKFPESGRASISWSALGMLVCPSFKKGCGCPTMVGPMNTQVKQRKVAAYRRRTKPTGRAAKPEQLEDNEDKKTDTDKNMATMFDILKRKKSVKLENLVVNRLSFAQTVENLFALSFLSKDGRVQISVDDKGTHRVAPMNAPDANLVATGEVVYSHFIFRFDSEDWKLMTDAVASGEELMPHRNQVNI